MPLRRFLPILLLLPRCLFSQDLSYVDDDFHIIKEANGLNLEIRRFACERPHLDENSVSRLSSSDAHKLYGLLQYIDISRLRSHYSVSWTDASILKLQLKFDANKVKQIEDYGGIGTYGLAALYDLLESFRKDLVWTSLDR